MKKPLSLGASWQVLPRARQILQTTLAVADSANRNRHRRSGFGRPQHMAPAIKDTTGINDHARRVNLSRHHTFGLNFNAALREDHAVEASGNHHTISFDLTFHLCAFAQDNCLLRNYVALHVAINAERSSDRERSFERHTLVDESCPLFAAGAILCCAGPLPCHIHSPKLETVL